ncbi:hypothetical protein PQC55_gp152 [Escherichia phage vB_EcoP-CHD5UKE1]|uniref:Uncharacterized protein n=1 Tax=Escherichia phage vB_EcoP-CHD5UKE1 TaxID=2865805 RepID=A0ABX9AGL2_9CAUD|nr:hypothetical protein PQC55_gp152 [Escherichia phage vB_EcoP-CHD5UKE1]QZI80606.1 hypothetical protein CHD5UKE1_110 [Escherichia phage vB_EcoP-CHD5UKE1]
MKPLYLPAHDLLQKEFAYLTFRFSFSKDLPQ